MKKKFKSFVKWLRLNYTKIKNAFSSNSVTMQELIYAIPIYDKQISQKWEALGELVNEYETGRKSKKKPVKALTKEKLVTEFETIYKSLPILEQQLVALKSMSAAINANAYLSRLCKSNNENIYRRSLYRNRVLRMETLVKAIEHLDMPEITAMLVTDLELYRSRIHSITCDMDVFNYRTLKLPFKLAI